MLTHENLASNASVLADLWRFTADDALIHALPVFHTHGLFVATNVALLAGATMIFQPRFDADADRRRPAARDLADGRADLLYPPLDHPGLTRKPRPPTCGFSSAARRRCSARRTGAGAKRPATPSSSATA